MKISRSDTGKIRKFILSEAEYSDLRENYCGACLACGDVSDGGVEPDAEKYSCDACGRSTVYGIELLLLAGRIEIDDATAQVGSANLENF